MRDLLLSLCLVAAGSAVAAPRPATQAPPATESASTDVTHRYLRCAVVVMLVADNTKDVDARVGLGASLGYFLGLWEGQTGLKFEDELTPEYIEETTRNLGKYNQQCDSDMGLYGERLQDWGKIMREAGRTAGK